MPDITQLLDAALDDEPAYTPDVDRLLALAHRRERRRRAAVGGSALGIATGIAALAVVLTSTGGPVTRPDEVGAEPSIGTAPTSSLAASRPSASTGDDRLTKNTVATLVEQLAGIRLSDAHVDVLPPISDIHLSAGIASAQGQYLNVQATPAGTSSTTAPTCADLSGNGADGDGYTRRCTVRALPDGGYLVVRSGRTSDGRFAKTQGDLVLGDGSAILAEATNQLAGELGSSAPHAKARGIQPAVSHDPPVTSTQLRRLVLALSARR